MSRSDGIRYPAAAKLLVVSIHSQPAGSGAEAGHADHVVELLRRRRVLGHVLARGVDEHRADVDAERLRQRRQQRVLVLAVAVAALQHLGRGARLHASDAERHVEVAHAARDQRVQCGQLLPASLPRAAAARASSLTFASGVMRSFDSFHHHRATSSQDVKLVSTTSGTYRAARWAAVGPLGP